MPRQPCRWPRAGPSAGWPGTMPSTARGPTPAGDLLPRRPEHGLFQNTSTWAAGVECALCGWAAGELNRVQVAVAAHQAYLPLDWAALRPRGAFYLERGRAGPHTQ